MRRFARAAARRGVWLGLAVMACQPMQGRCAEEHISDGNAVAGPMNAPSLAIGNVFRPGGYIAIPSYAPEGSWVLQSSLAWANTWNYQKDRYIVDCEWLQLAARVSHMATDDLEIGGLLPVLARTGGHTDKFIEGFHNTFALGNSRREGFPRNRSIVELRSRAGQDARWEGDQWGLSDVSLFASWTLTQGSRFMPCIVLGSAVTLPTGDADQLLGSGEPGYAVSALLTKRIAKTGCLLFLGTSASYAENNELTGSDTRKTQFGLLVGMAYDLNSRVSVVVQNLRMSPIARDFEEFSKPTNEVTIGFRIRNLLHGTWEIALQENMVYFNNGADVGLHVGYSCLL